MSSPVKQLAICDDESTEDANPINHADHLALRLPEMLGAIFSKLSVPDRGRVGRVCWNWREASNQPKVWRNVECRLHSDQHVPGAALHQRRIRYYKICPRDSPSLRATLTELADNLPDMHLLRFTGCDQLTDAILLDSLSMSGMPLMKRLILGGCSNLTDKSLELISRLMPNLVNLDLSLCKLLTDDSLLFIAVRLRNLKYLNLTRCPFITDKGIGYLVGNISTDDVAAALSRHDQQLSTTMGHLQVSVRCSIVKLRLTGCLRVTDDALQHLCTMMKLERLRLTLYKDLSDSGMVNLAKLGSLPFLRLSFTPVMGDESLEFLERMAIRLREMNVSCFSNLDELRQIPMATRMVVVTFLDIWSRNGIGSKAMRYIANHVRHLRKLPEDINLLQEQICYWPPSKCYFNKSSR